MLSRYEQFSSIISSIYRSIQKIEREEMIQYGFKGAYAQYLVAMHRYPEGITAAELCDVCGKDKAAVSRALAEMEAKGLVVKHCNHDNQYRAQLQLTEAGMDAADYVCRKAVAAVKIAGQELTDETRTILYRSLRGIAAHIQKISEEGIPE